ncbi:Putative Pol polyprotein, partial [Pterocles gutturalis]
WPLSLPKLTALDSIIQDLLADGRLEPSLSPWNSPIFVIQKKDKSKYRMLHDLRQVNNCIEDFGALQPGLPWPGSIPKDWPVVALDIKDCFFSIPLAERDRERFAFTVPSPNLQEPARRYQWKVLPQGMKNSPTICQLVVAQVLAPVRLQYSSAIIIHYMDDLLLSMATEEELAELESAVIKQCEKTGLYINNEKSQRGSSILYLGWRLQPQSIVPRSVELPTEVHTVNDLQRLLGCIQWLKPMLSIRPEQLNPLFDLL